MTPTIDQETWNKADALNRSGDLSCAYDDGGSGHIEGDRRDNGPGGGDLECAVDRSAQRGRGRGGGEHAAAGRNIGLRTRCGGRAAHGHRAAGPEILHRHLAEDGRSGALQVEPGRAAGRRHRGDQERARRASGSGCQAKRCSSTALASSTNAPASSSPPT